MNNKKQRNRLFTMLLLVMAILMPYEGAWAQTPTPPANGNGDVDNPFQISTAAELAWFRDYVNENYDNRKASAKLIADIDLSEFCYVADNSKIAKSWEPIGNSNKRQYEGTFDGNNKTITNLYINASQNNMGLFGYASGSTIKNLTFEKANVTNTEPYTGILVGKAVKGSTFQNIKISETCQMKGDMDTGGIAGELQGNASNCVNYGNVTATYRNVGGLVGYFTSGTIQDCANYGDVKGPECVAGMAGFVSSGKIQNVFSYGNVSATNSTQDIGMAFGSGSGTTEGMVAYYSGAKLTANGQEKDVKAFGSGTPSEDNATGFTEAQLKSGVVAYLLQQKASSEAKWGQNLANDGDIYPVIGSEHTVYADNSLVNCKTNEKISGSFTNNPTSSAIRYQHGTINHHLATGATCTEAATKEYWQCQDCQRTFSDSQLTKELTDVTNAEQPAFGHHSNEDGYCDRCQHYVAVKPSEQNGVYLIAKPCHLAWFRDYVNGTIVDEGEVAGTTHPSASAMLTADIDLKNYCHAAEGGKELLSWIPIGSEKNRWKGNMDGQGHTISHFYIKTAQDYVGLFGYTDGATIQDLIFDYAKVENVNTTGTKTDYTGILAGKAYGDSPSHIKGIKTTNNCTVIGQKDTGGIVGCAKINLENCENHSSVKGTGSVGGIAGSSFERNIKCCTNYGTVENDGMYIGGITGYAYEISIEDCANYGNITSAGPVAGGIAGSTMDNSSIQNVFSYGDVTYTNTSGIIIGHVGGTLTAKGIVAYNKEALLNNSSENIKIVGAGSLTLEDGKVEADVVKAFTKQQIKSGEVAWLLNGSTSVPTEGSTLAWYQKLGENGDEYPVLTPKDGNTVYYSDCTCVDKQVKIYSNMENEKFDKHAKGTETLLANGLYSSTCQRCQTNFMLYIKDFCGVDGNDLELTANADGSYTAAEPVDINDNAAYDSPVDFTAPTLKYNRSFAHDKWQALYVPFETKVTEELLKDFELAAPNNLHEYELADGKTKISLEAKLMKSGYTIKAQRPYLIRAKEAGEKTIQLTDCPLKEAAEDSYVDCSSVLRHYKFIGTLKGKTSFDTSADFVLQQGVFLGTVTDTQLKPMRWYLNATNRETDMGILPGSGNNGDDGGADGGNGSTQASRSINITIVDGDATTGIDELHVITEQTSGSKNGARLGIYDLQGRKLSQEPQNGVYIKDGKKVVK